MKLAALAFVLTVGTTLGIGGAARAEPGLAPPGMSPPVGVAPAPAPAPMPRPGRARGELRRVLLETFDANHNGRLEPDERRRATRALRRIARRMSSGSANDARRERAERRRERAERREQRGYAPAEAPSSEY